MLLLRGRHLLDVHSSYTNNRTDGGMSLIIAQGQLHLCELQVLLHSGQVEARKVQEGRERCLSM